MYIKSTGSGEGLSGPVRLRIYVRRRGRLRSSRRVARQTPRNPPAVHTAGGIQTSLLIFHRRNRCTVPAVKMPAAMLRVPVNTDTPHRSCRNPRDKAESGGCCGLSAVDDARRVADRLEIPYYVMNFKREFKKNVMDYFTAEYLKGRTPNPCIACNRYVKWESLLQRSLEIGADYIATGHYARVEQLSNGRYAIRNSVTAAKDQTYALFNLTQKQLSHTLMPVGDYTKDEIRAIAEDIGLMVAHKKDSQEICFIPDNDYAGFIDRECGEMVPPPGNFVSVDGEILGRHKGITHYTIGQRKGLGIAFGYPVFVTEIRPETNEVVLGSDKDVYTNRLYANQLNFMALSDIEEPVRLKAKIRYSHAGSCCTVRRTGADEICCEFEEPVRAVTPGQAVVLYDGDYVAGGGVITHA